MKTTIGTAIASDQKGHAAGENVAETAVGELGTDRVDFCQVFCSSSYDYDAVLDGIRSVVGEEAELIGCSSAGEFTEDGVRDQSVAVSLVTSDSMEFYTGMGTELSDRPSECIRSATNPLPFDHEEYSHLAAINLHDGLSGIGNRITRETQQKLGPHIPLVGGSAGDDLALEETHVFCNGRIESDAMVMALIASERPLSVTVNHGHEPVSDYMTVTEAEGGTVHEIDGKPAFEAWRDAVREDAMEEYDVDVDDLEDGSDELGAMLFRYEFGIPVEDDRERGLLQTLLELVGMADDEHYKIRWPGLTNTTDGPLEFAVEIPEGTELRAMHSGHDQQIQSVREAVEAAKKKHRSVDVAGGFVYDCVCRAAILEDEFEETIEAIDDELGAPFAGFETYGEVCMHMSDLDGFHNTTSVVMLLPE